MQSSDETNTVPDLTKKDLDSLDGLINQAQDTQDKLDDMYSGQGVWEKKDRWPLDEYGVPIAPKKVKDYGKRLISKLDRKPVVGI